MNITGLDHLVLTVASIDQTCRFYETVLGMTREDFGEGRVAVKFADQKINLHQAGHEFEPKSARPTPGSGDLCFLVADLQAAQTHAEACGVEIEIGPVARTGARGPMRSIYIRDPDMNLIEVAQYE